MEKTAISDHARAVLYYSRKLLATELPTLLPAIYLLQEEEQAGDEVLWTDGTKLFYDPEGVVRLYLREHHAVARQLLHIITHGILGHFAKREGCDPELFDVAADTKALEFLQQMAPKWFHANEMPRELRRLLTVQTGESLESLYLSAETPEDEKRMVSFRESLKVDDHSAWTCASGKDGKDGQQAGMAAMTAMWQAVRQQVAQNLADSGHGTLAGQCAEHYRDVEESGVSYAQFLRQFCGVREQALVDPDSMDNIWYHIGMEMNGDIPFLEPNEVREDQTVLELAVALDTSGSCCGDTAKEFLGELLAILRDAGGPKTEFTLIQCDAEIQKVQTMTREDTEEELLHDFELRGMGGTDFRPVFRYLEQQREDPEGKRFRGLLYLSDGWGDFPDKAPDYPVAFLFPRDEGYDSDMVPDWVTKVTISKDGQLIVENQTNEN